MCEHTSRFVGAVGGTEVQRCGASLNKWSERVCVRVNVMEGVEGEAHGQQRGALLNKCKGVGAGVEGRGST